MAMDQRDSPPLPRIPPPPIPMEPFPAAFTGSGPEYFRIWIVNLLLSIVTFGIYSAWAKVRRLQYFYRHTRIAEASFDFHGKPLAILKGRILAVMLFGSYYGAGLVSPVLGLVAFGLLAVLLPLLIVRSLRFRLHNSSYRGLRFRFSGKTGGAYWVFLGLPVLGAITFGVLMPFWYQRYKRFQHSNASYGATPFGFQAPVGGFYAIYAKAAGVVAVVGLMAAVMIAGVLTLSPEGTPAAGAPEALVVLVAAVYLFGLLGLYAFTTARVQNLVWNNTRLGPHRFTCTLKARRLFTLMLTNAVATMCTLGLFMPFAQVRMVRYFAESFSIVPGGSLDDFVAGEQQAVSAVGEEALDLLDIDLAF